MQISITNLQRLIPIPVSKINAAAASASKKLKLKHKEIVIVFTGSQRMRSINKKFLGHDYVTDVITFDHGEIVICPSVAQSNAKRFKTSVDKELILYVIHGLLHLAGYDDHSPKDIAAMRAMEEKLLPNL
jgi:probable rRNA maturation factor